MSELKPRITENGIDYILVGDYYIPDLKLPEEHRPIGKYGRMHLSLIHIWLSCHIASTGKQYQSHAATIYKWAQEDAAKGKAAPKQGIPDYSCKEGESL